jgi:peptidoglycan/LPS O-acetylase OafA/YrhL
MALGYTINYVHNDPPALGHLWSLACEMQFYTLAPLFFLLGRGRRWREMLVWCGILFLLIGIGLIVPTQVKNYEWIRYHFEIAAWPMMLGFCCQYGSGWVLKLPRRVVKILHTAGVATLVISIGMMVFGLQTKMLVIALGAGALFPCLLGYLFGVPFPGQVGRFLAWTGERTYSIYLWQQPLTICNFVSPAIRPAGAAFAIIVGALSFCVFEKPFLAASRTRTLGAVPVDRS